MAEVRKQFTNKEVADKFEYSGSWDVFGKEKRIVWPGVYDGLLCEIDLKSAEKMLAQNHPFLKLKSATAKKNNGEPVN